MTLKRKIATRKSWDIRPMPEEKIPLSVKREFSLKEYELLQKGFFPMQMEEKWFIFFEDNKLYFHRSWTGICVFEVELERNDKVYRIKNVWFNPNSTKFNVDEEMEVMELNIVINNYLLGKGEESLRRLVKELEREKNDL